MNKKIGLVSYSQKITNYTSWLSSLGGDIELVKLHHDNDNASRLNECSGLVLTGGDDINPVLYGENNNEGLSKGIDDKRDTFEYKLLEIADKNRIPTLGICRGLQISNVFYGGSLYQHIDHHRGSGEDKRHRIDCIDCSLLYKITKNITGVVNSAHHQAAKVIPQGLIATSFAEDGTIESIEFSEPKYPFLLVQWHPERMIDRESNEFSLEILKWFLNQL